MRWSLPDRSSPPFRRRRPWRWELERLEERLLLAGDILVDADNRLQEYQQNGTQVSAILVPNPPNQGSDESRGVTVDSFGKVDIYNGTFDPYLATYTPATNSWTQQTFPGWSTVNNVTYGGVTAFQNFVFASDMNTGGAPENGIVRFDLSGGPTVRFANGIDFIDVTMGLDGLIYGDTGQSVFVYDPLTLAPIRNFNLPLFDVRSIAVDASGNILAAQYEKTVTKLDPSATQVLASETFPNGPHGEGEALVSIALDTDGQVAVGDRWGRFFITDESLASFTPVTVHAYTIYEPTVFVTFNHYIPSNVPVRNPVPAINGLSQSSAVEGSGSVVLTLTGTGFVSSSVVQWNGQTLSTSFISAMQVQATVPAVDLAEDGSANITVFNPAPGGGTSNSELFSITDADLTASATTITASSTVAFSGQVATFDDANTTAPLSDFTTGSGGVSIDWGDGSAAGAGTVTQPGGAGTAFVVTGSHTYSLNGRFAIHIIITDLGGSMTTATATAYVSSPGLQPSGTLVISTQVVSFSGLVASFIDTDPNAPLSDFTTGNSGAMIDWGDGTPATAGTITQPGGTGATFMVNGSHIYAEEGAYTITVNIVDLDGDTAIAPTTANVIDAPLNATGVSVQTTEGSLFSGQVASCTDAEPNAPLADFTMGNGGATIDWGDGSATSSEIVSQPGGAGSPFLISGSHTYQEEGAYNISVTILDAEGSQTTTSATASVSDAPLSGSAMSLQPDRGVLFSGAVATFADADPSAPLTDFSTGSGGATINWGDGTATSAGVISQPGGSGSTFIVSGSHTYSAVGTYFLSVTIADLGGQTTTITDNVTVRVRSDLIARWSQMGQWWLGTSTGSGFTMSQPLTWSTGASWVDVVTGDFNGDGLTDIAGRVKETGDWWVSLGNGSGGFTTSKWTSWSTGGTWVDVKVGDFNGDGKADLTARDLGSGTWWTALSTGTSFTTTMWAAWSTGATWVDVKVGDFNGDGKADITARALQNGQWYSGLSNGSTAFSTSLWATWSTAATWVDVQVGDFNGDGMADITGRYLQGGSWWTALSNGTGFATSPAPWATWSTGATWVDAHVGDFNGDGKADIIGRALENGQWYIALSNGSNGFTTTRWGTWSTGATWVDVQIGDFNGDGKTDIIGRALENGQWYVALSNGSAFSTALWAVWSTAVTWVDVHVGDLT
jgi:hypothetical protein